MDDADVAKVVDEWCTRRRPYGQRIAHGMAADNRRRGRRSWCYRCPFDPSHWHVSPVRSIARLERLAAVLLARQAA